MFGAVVAAGVSVLLAQSATWTTPRNWATDDLLTATDFNSQFRDNLLWLRQDAELTGTDALEDLGCGTLGTNEVLFSDCSWATIPAGVVFDIHDDVGTAATIADNDRIPFSDESVNSDPMRFSTAANIADYMQGEVELSANRVTSDTFNTARIPNLSASKITSDTFPTARYANESVTQAKIADAAVGVPQLKLGTGSVQHSLTGNNVTYFDVPRYSYLPRIGRNSGTRDCTLRHSYNASVSTTSARMRVNGDGNGTDVTCTVNWDNATASDTPSVWVLLRDSDGTVTAMWEAEDPASIGDTVAPMSVPFDDDDNPLPGFTIINVGLPALSVIEALYATLPADQRTAALRSTGDYVMGRGWFYNLTSLSQLASIPARYEPSGRQWAMRCAANAAIGVSGCKDAPVTGFYLDNLVVDAGVWAVAP